MARALHIPPRMRHRWGTCLAAIFAFAACVPAIACGGESKPALRLDPGPLLLVAEGDTIRAAVTLDPPDSALTPADVDLIVDPARRELFVDFDIVAAPNGAPELVVQPLCNVIGDDGRDVVVPATIRSRSGDAHDAQVLVQIRPGAAGPCAPEVQNWLGLPDCSDEPPDGPRATSIPIEPQASPQTLCLRISSKSPERPEMLFVTTDTTAPRTFLPERPAPSGSGVVTAIIPINDSRYFRGEFEVVYQIFRDDPMTGAPPVVVGSVTLAVGDPGDLAISVHRNTVLVDEFDAVTVPFRTWWYDVTPETPDAPPCVKAIRIDDDLAGELPRRKPSIQVVTAQGVPTSRADGWHCAGDTFVASVSPAIDSEPLETLLLLACRCDASAGASSCDEQCLDAIPPVAECGGQVPAGVILTCIDVPLDVTSVADELPAPAAAPPAPADPRVVCADTTGDATPEIVVATETGAAYAYTAVDGRYDAPIGVATPDSLRGHAGRIFGSFGGAIFELVIDDTTAPATATWIADDTITIDDLTHAVSAGPGTSVTHLVQMKILGPDNVEIVYDCDAPCVDHSSFLSTTVADQMVVGGVRRGDSVVFFLADTISGQIWAKTLLLDWTCGLPPCLSQTSTVAGPVASVPPSRVPAVETAAGDVAFVVDGVIHLVGGGTIATPAPAIDLASIDGRFVVASTLGVHEIDLVTAIATQRDPLFREDALLGLFVPPPDGYAASLAACEGGFDDTIAYTSSDVSVRTTRLDVDVALP